MNELKPITRGDIETMRAMKEARWTEEPLHEQLRDLTWGTYRKTSDTQAARMSGPFAVKTSESPGDEVLVCEDGYLAIDARGYPYPIATEEFELIYEEASDSTIVALLTLAFDRAHNLQQGGVDGMVARELALAKTHIEDAIMRVNRGVAAMNGRFVVADIERTINTVGAASA